MRHWIAPIVVVVLASPQPADSAAQPGSSESYGRIELLRDQWGIPHVDAQTDAGAMYGLGWSTAEDRGFQMYYNLRIIQGRLAELVGDVKKTRRRDTALENDRKMRTFGFYHAAKALVAHLDPDTRSLLEAYSGGVNDYFARHRDDRHYLFERLDLSPEPWTPAACIASWWHLAQFFATDGTRDLIAYRNSFGGGPRDRALGDRGRRARAERARAGRDGGGRGSRADRRPRVRPGTEDLQPLGPDDSTAVVRSEDVSDVWKAEVRKFARDHGIPVEETGAGADSTPKFSHAWVVGRTKTTTGSSVLVSDPQTNVANPSLFYEFHVRGKTIDARGVGVPGSPIILIGWTSHVAWGMTALGADQADLFRLKTDSSHPGEYFLDGEWLKFETRKEEIKVKGAAPQLLQIESTVFGPVVTEFCFARPGDAPVALKRIPICETDRETVQGAMAMLRARDVHQFLEAIAGWRFPTANVIFTDRRGNVGYSVIGAIPVRSTHARQNGRQAHDGSSRKFDWQGLVPPRLVPHVLNPRSGYILSGNHRAVGSFYPIPLGVTTGAGGETLRSWRLRERLATKSKFTPQDVLAIHYDTVNPARRTIVGLGLHLRDGLERDLSEEALAALEHLEAWYQAGASSDLNAAGAALAGAINTLFRLTTSELTSKYGGGESGLAYFLKDLERRIEKDPKATLNALEEEFIDNALAGAWRRCQNLYGPEPARWDERARRQVEARTLGYYASLDGFGSLDPGKDIGVPGITCVDGSTIKSQSAQAYTQWVPMDDVDSARSLLPIGASELPGSPYRLSAYDDWTKGALRPAPLSRKAVEKYVRSRQVLSRSPRKEPQRR